MSQASRVQDGTSRASVQGASLHQPFRRVRHGVLRVELTPPLLPLCPSSQPVLSSIRTQTALGTILNAVLGRMLDEIIGLQDITTKESSRLNEACRMIHPLEELFVEAPGQVSFHGCLLYAQYAHGKHQLIRSVYGSPPRSSRSSRCGSSSAISPSSSYVTSSLLPDQIISELTPTPSCLSYRTLRPNRKRPSPTSRTCSRRVRSSTLPSTSSSRFSARSSRTRV